MLLKRTTEYKKRDMNLWPSEPPSSNLEHIQHFIM